MKVMDTVAGARILQSRIQFAFRPDQPVMHGDRPSHVHPHARRGRSHQASGRQPGGLCSVRQALPSADEAPLPRPPLAPLSLEKRVDELALPLILHPLVLDEMGLETHAELLEDAR